MYKLYLFSFTLEYCAAMGVFCIYFNGAQFYQLSIDFALRNSQFQFPSFMIESPK